MNQSGREAPGEPNAAVPRGVAGESIETALQLAVDLHGPALLNRPDKLRGLLDAQCPNAGFDLSFLMVALEEGVPQSLLALNSAQQMQVVVPELQEQLAARRGLNPFAATWAVSTWAAALRMDLFGDPTIRGVVRQGQGAAKSVLAPLKPAAAVEPRRDETAVFVAPPPSTVPFGILSKSTVPSSPSPPAAPEPVTVASTPAAEPAASTAAETVREEGIVPRLEAAEVAPPAEAHAHVPAAEPVPVPAPVAMPAPVAQPMPAPVLAPIETLATIPAATIAAASPASVPTPDPVRPVVEPPPAPSAPATPASVANPAAAEPVLPTWAAGRKAAPAADRSRFKPLWGVAGVLAAIVVAFAAIRLMASLGGQDGPAPTSTNDPVAPAATSPPVAAAVPAAAPPATPPAPTPVVPSIVDVVSDGTLLGDGDAHPVFVAIDPSGPAVRSVEKTFMSGDGTWESGTQVIEVAPDAVRDGRIAVGSIGLRTTKPATATFQYVLTTTDGQRSTPFVKQFAFAPVAGRAPVIDDIVVPPGIVAGVPFTLTIRYTPGESHIASVERATVGADGPPRTTSLAGLASPKEGTLRYPVEAIAAASRTTYAITLIDADGARSDAKQIVVDAAASKRPDEKVADAAPKEKPVACTRATCGSVVAVREIDRTKTYEVIARMDDRSIRTIVSTAVWKVGTRVRQAGSRFAPVDAAVVVAPARPKPTARTTQTVTSESPPIFDR